jgi:hypothetical protein
MEARDQLASQVAELQEVLHLQKQFAQLSTEFTSLQASFKETLLAPPALIWNGLKDEATTAASLKRKIPKTQDPKS